MALNVHNFRKLLPRAYASKRITVGYMSHFGSEHEDRREESGGEDEEAAFETPDMEEFLEENSTADEL